jgi:hypothetical protein
MTGRRGSRSVPAFLLLGKRRQLLPRGNDASGALIWRWASVKPPWANEAANIHIRNWRFKIHIVLRPRN